MKVLRADAVTDSQFLRFMQEIEIQGRLSHPNIARVHRALHCKDSLILVPAPSADQPEIVSETFAEPDPVPVERPAQEIREPSAGEQPQPPVEKKKHFWNKLNPLKRHKAAPSR